MAHSPDSGDGPAVFDREFLLLDDLIRDGSHLEFEQLKSVVADAEFERAEAEGKARRAEARAKRLAKQLEQTAAERDGALRQVAEASGGERSSTVLGLRLALGEAEGERDMVRAALARVVAAVMNGAHDPLGDALDVLEVTGGTVPALASRHLLAVAA